MKTSRRGRLMLHVETVRNLSGAELRGVVGGADSDGCETRPPTDFCSLEYETCDCTLPDPRYRKPTEYAVGC